MRGLTQSIGMVVACTLGVGSAVAIGSDSGPDGMDARAAATLPNSLTINGVAFKHGRANRTITINGVPFKRSAAGKTITINGTAFKGSARGQTLTINGTAFKGSARGQTLTINGTTFKSSGGTLTINGMVFRPGAGPTVPPEIAAQLRGPTGPAGPTGATGAPGPAPGPAPVEVPGPVAVSPSGAGGTAPSTLVSVPFTGGQAHRVLLSGGFTTVCDPCGSSQAFPTVDVILEGTSSPLVRRGHPPLTSALSRNGFSFSEIVVTPTVCGPCTFVLRLGFPNPNDGTSWTLVASDIRLGLVDLGPVT